MIAACAGPYCRNACQTVTIRPVLNFLLVTFPFFALRLVGLTIWLPRRGGIG